MNYEKKIQFGGWLKRPYREVRSVCKKFWQEDYGLIPSRQWKKLKKKKGTTFLTKGV